MYGNGETGFLIVVSHHSLYILYVIISQVRLYITNLDCKLFAVRQTNPSICVGVDVTSEITKKYQTGL